LQDKKKKSNNNFDNLYICISKKKKSVKKLENQKFLFL